MSETGVATYLGLLVGLGRAGRIAEPPPSPDPLSEAELADIWAGQRFPAEALTTLDGEPVRVLNPGRRGTGPGPDFRDAVVQVDGRQQRGDVELHLRASYFHAHGHGDDPAYARLALHVVYLADDGASTPLPGGGSVVVAQFAPWLEQRSQELQRWLAAPDAWAQPCRDAGRRLGDEAVARVLQDGGLRRFEARVAAARAAIREAGCEEALWRALLDALGVGGQREAFRRLGLALTAAAASRAIAGLDAAEAVKELTAALLGALDEAPSAGGRPANRPQRRLAALAQLFVRARGELWPFACEGLLAAKGVSQLVGRWQVGGAPALLGRERAQELLLNAVLPALATDASLLPAVLRLLDALPALTAYGKTAFLEENLRRGDGKRRPRGVLQQQGLLALLGDWCARDGCGRCPLS